MSPATSIVRNPASAVLLRELADGGGLAGAVHADHQHDVGRVRAIDRERPGDRGEDGGDLLGKRGADLLAGDFLAEARAAEGGDDSLRSGRAEIGADQQVLELGERRLVEAPAGEDGADALGELLLAALQPFLEARKEGGKRHQARAAMRPDSSEPTTRARSSAPAGASAARRAGTYSRVWPRPPASTRTETLRPRKEEK